MLKSNLFWSIAFLILLNPGVAAPGLSHEQTRRALVFSISVWESVCGVDIDTKKEEGKQYDTYTIKQGRIAGIAETNILFSSITLNPNYKWNEEFARRVFMHEIGHVMWLYGGSHSKDPSSIMYGSPRLPMLPNETDIREAVRMYKEKQ